MAPGELFDSLHLKETVPPDTTSLELAQCPYVSALPRADGEPQLRMFVAEDAGIVNHDWVARLGGKLNAHRGEYRGLTAVAERENFDLHFRFHFVSVSLLRLLRAPGWVCPAAPIVQWLIVG